MKYLIYCTKAKPYLLDVGMNEENPYEVLNNGDSPSNYAIEPFNGKIIAEFECDNVERFEFNTMSREIFSYWYENGHEVDYDKMCLTYEELWDYLGDSIGYALHVSNLMAFDEPLKLNEVKTLEKQKAYEKALDEAYKEDCKIADRIACDIANDDEIDNCVELTECTEWTYGLKRAPSNMQMVWHNGELKVLIPCTSKECANLFNGNATILVRSKVLKECL